MAPTLSKEAILEGVADQLCLACESHLRSAQEALQHVDSAGHRENLARTRYVDKYADDRVRKVKKWYLCEFCNVVMSTVISVGLHVQEPGHKENRLSQIMERVGDAIVCGDITIQQEAWHGLTDDSTCVVCNVEYEDKEAHQSEPSHIINLIQSKIYDVNGNVYRKIDDSTFHCLTCNAIVRKIVEHLDGTRHKELVQQNIKMAPSKREEADQHNNSKILNSITKFQKDKININFESRTAVCKKCSMNLQFNYEVIENHIEVHKNNMQIKDSGTTPILIEKDEKNNNKMSEILFTRPVHRNHNNEDSENVETKLREAKEQGDSQSLIQKVAEENGLSYSSIENKVYCKTCYKNIISSVKNIKEHVNGALHKNNTRLASGGANIKSNEIVNKINENKCNFLKVPIQQFLKAKLTIEDDFSTNVILNEKYCIDSLSYYFLTLITPERVNCHVCEKVVPYNRIDDHVKIDRHERVLKETPVVIVDDSEFIREIRSGSFHCGFCNVIESWGGMEEHLKSSQHKERKTVASRRLMLFAPLVARERMERELRQHFLRSLLS